jgi:hypothetical protein
VGLTVGGNALGVGLELLRKLSEQFALSLANSCDLAGKALLYPIEITGPLGESPLHLLLRATECRRKLLPCARLVLGDGAPALLGDAALFLDEERGRVRARPGERALQLRRTRRRLPLDDVAEATLRACHLVVDRPAAPDEPRQRDGGGLGAGCEGEAGCADCNLELGIERERDPGGSGGEQEQERERVRETRVQSPATCKRERTGRRAHRDAETDRDDCPDHSAMVGARILRPMGLAAELEAIAARAAEYADDRETVEGVLAAEPNEGERLYLCSFALPDGRRSWLVLDAEARPIESRARVREAVSITALCEVAEEAAGGGDVAELRSKLVTLRLTENPPGIAEAEEAALALESALAPPPRVASPSYLDALGAATRRLERALGDDDSPFASAMQSAVASVDALTREVEATYKRPLS